MELKQLWVIGKRWWWLILLPTLVVGAYSVFTYRAPATSYGMTLRYTADQPQTPPNTTGFDPNYYRWLTSEYVVNGLKDWVRTGAFAAALSRQLASQGVALPPEAVAGSVAATDNVRSILIVYLSWGDPQQLMVIAEAVTSVLQTENAAAFPQLAGRPATVTALDTPSVAILPPPLSSRAELPLRLGLGLALGLALALVAYYLDPFVRDQHDLEQSGLTVIARIPPVQKSAASRARRERA